MKQELTVWLIDRAAEHTAARSFYCFITDN
jgi:hypothetical protein